MLQNLMSYLGVMPRMTTSHFDAAHRWVNIPHGTFSLHAAVRIVPDPHKQGKKREPSPNIEKKPTSAVYQTSRGKSWLPAGQFSTGPELRLLHGIPDGQLCPPAPTPPCSWDEPALAIIVATADRTLLVYGRITPVFARNRKFRPMPSTPCKQTYASPPPRPLPPR